MPRFWAQQVITVFESQKPVNMLRALNADGHRDIKKQKVKTLDTVCKPSTKWMTANPSP